MADSGKPVWNAGIAKSIGLIVLAAFSSACSVNKVKLPWNKVETIPVAGGVLTRNTAVGLHLYTDGAIGVAVGRIEREVLRASAMTEADFEMCQRDEPVAHVTQAASTPWHSVELVGIGAEFRPRGVRLNAGMTNRHVTRLPANGDYVFSIDTEADAYKICMLN